MASLDILPLDDLQDLFRAFEVYRQSPKSKPPELSKRLRSIIDNLPGAITYYDVWYELVQRMGMHHATVWINRYDVQDRHIEDNPALAHNLSYWYKDQFLDIDNF